MLWQSTALLPHLAIVARRNARNADNVLKSSLMRSTLQLLSLVETARSVIIAPDSEAAPSTRVAMPASFTRLRDETIVVSRSPKMV